MVKKNEALKWGEWECPVCQNTLKDSEQTFKTSCSCGAYIDLGNIDEHGNRSSTLVTKN